MNQSPNEDPKRNNSGKGPSVKTGKNHAGTVKSISAERCLNTADDTTMTNHNDTVHVSLTEEETAAAVTALRNATAEHNDRGRDFVADGAADYRKALETSLEAFGHFKAKMARRDATALGNDISYGIQFGDVERPTAVRSARSKFRDASRGGSL